MTAACLAPSKSLFNAPHTLPFRVRPRGAVISMPLSELGRTGADYTLNYATHKSTYPPPKTPAIVVARITEPEARGLGATYAHPSSNTAIIGRQPVFCMRALRGTVVVCHAARVSCVEGI